LQEKQYYPMRSFYLKDHQ